MRRWWYGWWLLPMVGAFQGATPAAVVAQSASAGDITVSLQAVDGLAVSQVRDLRFGVTTAGAGAISVDATSPDAGAFHLYGSNARPINVTFGPPAALSSTEGGSVPYTWAATYNENADDASTAAGAVSVVSNPVVIRTRHSVGSSRRAYIWIHGSVSVGAVPAGTYTGVFTITAAY